MSYTHLKDRNFYEDIYDKHTVEDARRHTKSFNKMYENFLKKFIDEDPESFRSKFHFNWIYMLLVGNDLVDRYDNKDKRLTEWMAEDEVKDHQIKEARLTTEPICVHCGKTGLRIIDKDLHHKNGIESPEMVLFMLKCPSCSKNSAYWEDGEELEHRKTYCSKCHAEMKDKAEKKPTALVTTYTCPNCGHSFIDKLDFTVKKEQADPQFEIDRQIYCLQDEKLLKEFRDAKYRLEGMAKMGKEFKEKELNKHIYDAMKDLKKLKITELKDELRPVLEKAGFTEFSLDKPEIGRDVFIGFNCLDSNSARGDYDSQNTLKKLVKKALLDSNWRLMSEGISYRLGYLNGRLRAYEKEDDLKNLVMKTRKLKEKSLSKDE
jgi:hypothetical protein